MPAGAGGDVQVERNPDPYEEGDNDEDEDMKLMEKEKAIQREIYGFSGWIATSLLYGGLLIAFEMKKLF